MFWFLLAMVLLTPAIMLGVGFAWKKHPPGEINDLCGYRTKRSMMNQETWKFAHAYCAKIWRVWNGVLLLLSAALLFLFRSDFVNASLWVIGFQIVVLCLSIFLTERALKKNFDENGNRRDR